MRARFWIASMVVVGMSAASAQTTANKAASLAQLELTIKVATTNDNGSPQALRFTLTNIGSGAIDLPMPAIDCQTGNGQIRLHSKVVAGTPSERSFGHGWGGGGGRDARTLVERIKKCWFRLQPGEFVVFTGDGRSMLDKTEGLITYEYWAEYEPPKLSDAEKTEAELGGYRVPVEPVVSAHLTYTERWPVEE